MTYVELLVTPNWKRNNFTVIELEDIEVTLRVWSLEPGDWELISVLANASGPAGKRKWMEVDNKHLRKFVADYLETERDWIDEQVAEQLKEEAA